jgi:hypothetical protein
MSFVPAMSAPCPTMLPVTASHVWAAHLVHSGRAGKGLLFILRVSRIHALSRRPFRAQADHPGSGP